MVSNKYRVVNFVHAKLVRVACCCTFLVVLPVSPQAQAWLDDVGVFATAKSITYSENMPIDAFDNDFSGGEPREGSHALTFNEYAVGFRYKGWEVAKVQRFDYFFNFNSETFDIFYNDANDIDFIQDEIFNVDLDVSKVEMEGVRFGYRWEPSPALKLYLAVNYFEADDVLYGAIEGNIWQGNTRLVGDLNLNYYYTEDVVFDRTLTDPASGYGYSFDFSASWQVTQRVLVDVAVYDVVGRINWKHAPYTRAEMVSDRNRVDDEGRAYKVPTLSAREGFTETIQALPVHQYLSVAYDVGHDLTVTAEYERFDEVGFRRLYCGYKPWSWFEVTSGFDFKSRAKSLEFWTPYFSLLAASDRTDLKQSRNVRVDLVLQYSL